MINHKRKESPRSLNPLNISYERILPIIRDLPEFKWPAPIQMDPSQRNKSLRCDYHRDHGHETDRCRSLKFMVEKLIKAGHLRRYVKEPDQEVESGQAANRITIGTSTPTESRPTINYILGGPSDDQYQSKCQQKKLLRPAKGKARVNVIHAEGRHKETKPIDGPIPFPPVNPNRIIMPYHDALVLNLYINGFDVHKVLVDPDSAPDLLQLQTFEQMKFSLGMLNSARWILSSFNDATTTILGDVALLVKGGPMTQRVLFSIVEDLGPYNSIMGRAWLHSMKAILQPTTKRSAI